MLDILYPPKHNVIMNPDVLNTEKTLGFLDKLGQDDPQRLKRKAELVEEYERFKRLDEERFRNRFADKKNRNADFPMPEMNRNEKKFEGSVPQVEISETRGVSHEIPELEEKMNRKLNEIVQRIENLQPASNLIKPGESSLQENHPTMVHDDSILREERSRLYEHLLRDRLHNIQEAENKLAAIEREYNQAKLALMGKVEKDLNISPSWFQSPTPTNVKLSVSDIPTQIGDNDNNRKYLQQQQYRKELESQIIEAQQRRKATAELNIAERESNLLMNLPQKSIQQASDTSRWDPEYLLVGNQNLLLDSAKPASQLLGSSVANVPSAFQNKQTDQTTTHEQAENESAKKAKYARELREQMEESRKRKELQKKKDEEYDRKIEEQCLKHNSAVTQHDIPSKIDSMAVGHPNTQPMMEDQSSFARGGHGIFGSPLSEDQKVANQKYKEDLAKQIQEKRARDEAERRKQQEEEEKENERLAAEQRMMQARFEEERNRMKTQQKEAELVAETLKIETTHQQPEIIPRKQRDRPKQDHNIRTENVKKREKKQQAEPELLIDRPASNKTERQISQDKDIRTNRVLEQLKDLRSRVDQEKTRVREALTHQQLSEDVFSKGDVDKRKPKLVRKAAHLFDTNSGFTYWNNNEKAVNSNLRYAADEKYSMNQQQIAYMRALDEGLRKLNARDLMSDLELRHQRLVRPRLTRRGTDSSDSTINADSTTPFKRTPSETSLDVFKLQATNTQRLERLTNLHLEKRRNSDPEELLDNFVKQCDTYSKTQP